MAIELAPRYEGISAQGFAHPADRAATAALKLAPGLDRLVKFLAEHGFERRLRQIMLGNAVRLGESQLPAIWARQQHCADVLDLKRCPRLYITQETVGNGLTIGTNKPVTLISSGLVNAYSDEELEAVLAHEMGHVLADHVGLSTALQFLQMIVSGTIRTIPLAGIPVTGLYLALLEWSRAAELTADRASAVVTGEPMLVCRMLMRMAGGPVEGLSIDAFITQATEYEEEPDPFTRYSRFMSEITRTHPIPVRRVRELIEWVRAGDLDRIRAGSYLRRGEEPPPSADFDTAFQYYRKRFTKMFERANEGINTVFERITTWIGGDTGPQAEPTDN